MAYTGIDASGLEIINLYSVSIRTGPGPSGLYDDPQIEKVLTLSLPGNHFAFPQLIAVDHLAGSDLQLDSPVLLRFTQVTNNLANDTVIEWVLPFYSGTFGAAVQMASWSRSATFPGTNCSTADATVIECFAGDYRYGAFYQKLAAAGSLRFFTPWTGESPTMGVTGPRAQGAFVDVIP
jgi:hypothetical protein